MNNNLKGYNPLRNQRGDAFNKDAGRKVFTETCNDVSSAQKEQAARRLQDLIQKSQADLTNDPL